MELIGVSAYRRIGDDLSKVLPRYFGPHQPLRSWRQQGSIASCLSGL